MRVPNPKITSEFRLPRLPLNPQVIVGFTRYVIGGRGEFRDLKVSVRKITVSAMLWGHVADSVHGIKFLWKLGGKVCKVIHLKC